MTTCELRLKAAKLIETRGFGKYAYFGANGECCLLGALQLASRHDSALIRAALDAMRFPESPVAVSCWNDAPERTAAHVLARLRKGCFPASDRPRERT